eukprot:CAMPEP_0173332920 /NCGR_PEP_ID=MMETSP1144-20121109/4602_1 /TAXON_ID=483371 /ORGANISM="non described non described, Strain CCMP2298" /LENGTH=49 /DNA_ID= /DNA_START= /DNA_END= /DNA_ORIENTATION=
MPQSRLRFECKCFECALSASGAAPQSKPQTAQSAMEICLGSHCLALSMP